MSKANWRTVIPGDTRVDEPFEDQASNQEDPIIGETLNLSTVKGRTWSKSKKYNI